MPSSSQSSWSGPLLLFAASLVGAALALYAYFTPLTGVNGTFGALLVIVAAIVLAAASLVLGAMAGRAPRNVLRGLIVLGVLGTAVAGLLLHQWWIAVAMAVALIGVFVDVARWSPAARPSH